MGDTPNQLMGDQPPVTNVLNATRRPGMNILVDADACPGTIRDIVCRAGMKRGIAVLFVANQPVNLPASSWLSSFQVPQGFDQADDEIVRRAQTNDLVITADIPLASEVLAKGAHALTPRGERYTEANIKQRLQMRDFMETMRATGERTGGPPPLSQTDRKAFADQLDRLLTRYHTKLPGSD
jgi:uncharacterized protein YaiI (UPF0178 family)